MSGPLLPSLRDRLRGSKLTVDLSYSLGSFAILAASGLVMSLAVTALRDVSALGIFNRAYAVLIVASQFGAWGIHYSVLRFAAFHREEPEERRRMLGSACVAALALGVMATAATWAAAPLLRGQASEESVDAIRNASLALTLFPLNKVLLAYLNGLRMMRAFAILQAVRYLMVMVGVTAFAATELPIGDACLAFAATELVLAALTLAILARLDAAVRWRVCGSWLKRHLRFGTKAMASGMFAEVNSRLDVLLVGYFVDDRETGIYSFAAMLSDGLYHVLAVVRINFNPMLVSITKAGAWSEASRLRGLSQRWIAPAIAVGSVIILLALVAADRWLIPGKGIAEGVPSLAILLAGLTLVSWLVPFDNLMIVSGHPGYQTLQQAAAILANVAVTLVLLPRIGIEGAAIGTVAYQLGSATMLIVLARRLLSWDPFRGRHYDR